jgi:NADPH:quinone reductase-like Zn-dependent oxidoreductase
MLCICYTCVRYDCVGGLETWTNSHNVLKPWGKFVTIAGDEQAPLRPLKLLTFGAKMLGRKMASCAGVSPSYYMVSTFDNSHTYLDIIASLVQEGKLSVLIDSEHDFTTQGVRDALLRSMSQRAVGKIIVRVRQSDTNTRK